MKKMILKFNVAIILFGLLSVSILCSKTVTPIIYSDIQKSYISSHDGFKIIINEQEIKFFSYHDSLKKDNNPSLIITLDSKSKIEAINSAGYLNLFTSEIIKEDIPLIKQLKLRSNENTITFFDDGKIEFDINNYEVIKFAFAEDIEIKRTKNIISFNSKSVEFSFSLPKYIEMSRINENEIEFIFDSGKFKDKLQSIEYEISYLTYLGKSVQPDRLMSIDVDDEGNYYVCGFTESSNFYELNPDTELKHSGSLDGFISKFDKDNQLLWSSYWGGGNRDYLYRVRLDSKGNVWVAGDSESGGIPMRGNSYDNTLAGNSDALLGKFSNDGKLLYSTFAGGESYDSFTNFSIDPNDNIWCTGRTVNADFPITADAYQQVFKGDYESFIMKFSNDGGLLYSSFMGGSGADFPEAFHVGKDFSVVEAGFTNSTDYPVINIANSTKSGGYDIFVVKHDSTGFPLWSRLIGGSGDDKCNNLIVDDDGFIYISGYVKSTNISVSPDAFQKKLNGNIELFLAKLSPDGDVLKSTYFGGKSNEGLDVLWAQWGGMTINESGNILVSGSTLSNDFPMIGNPMIDKFQGYTDGFIIELTPDLEPVWSTYLGGSDDDEPKDINAKQGKIYSVGWTSSKNLVTDDKSFQKVYGGNLDGYIAIITIPEPSILDIENKVIDFGKVEIGSYKDTIQVLTIKCIGGRSMRINETRHYLPNDKDFTTIAGGGNFTIKPNSTHKMDLKFTPSFIGKTSGTLEFHFEGDYSPLVIQLLGEGVKTILDVENRVIDFGKVEIGSYKDTIQAVTIKSVGYFPLKITETRHYLPNDKDFTTIAGGGNFIIQPNTSHKMDLKFTPSFIGKTSGTLEFHFEDDYSPLVIQLIGEGVKTILDVESRVIDFGKVEIGSYKDTIQAVTIKSVGYFPLKITETRHYLPNDSDFTTIAGGGNFTIQPNTSHKMDLKFTPSFVGKTSGTLEFHFEDDYSPLVIQLIGEGVFTGVANVQLYPESREANAGDIVEIPIILINSRNLQYTGITGFNLEFDYNSTLLAPIDEIAFYKSENWSSIKLNNLPAKEGEIGRIKFAACLGNAESTPLILSNVETIDGNADIMISEGVFKLLDLCYEGGVRLINPASSLINSVSPNPAESAVTIDFQLSEKGRTEIQIVNYMGEVITRRVYHEVTNFGNFKEIFDLSKFSSGYYNIFIKTPTMLESKGFVIIRN